MTPGRKFWTTTSASRARRRTTSRPSSVCTSTAIERFPRLHTRKSALIPPTETPTQRPMSPMPGRSTLITSAPWSASSATAYGPVRAIDRSRTFTPASGPSRTEVV